MFLNLQFNNPTITANYIGILPRFFTVFFQNVDRIPFWKKMNNNWSSASLGCRSGIRDHGGSAGVARNRRSPGPSELARRRRPAPDTTTSPLRHPYHSYFESGSEPANDYFIFLFISFPEARIHVIRLNFRLIIGPRPLISKHQVHKLCGNQRLYGQYRPRNQSFVSDSFAKARIEIK